MPTTKKSAMRDTCSLWKSSYYFVSSPRASYIAANIYIKCDLVEGSDSFLSDF